MFVRFKQTGDTIVEVLIAIAIVGAVLAGAYTVANKSSIQIRDAQERGEAQKFAAEIVERLRSNAKNNPTLYTTTGSQFFCIVSGTSIPGHPANTREPLSALPAVNATTGYDPNCAKQGSPITYNSAIEHDVTVPNSTLFTVYVRWAALGGGFNEVRYEYGIEK